MDFWPLVFCVLLSVAVTPHHYISLLYPSFKTQKIFPQLLHVFSFPDFELEVQSLLRTMCSLGAEIYNFSLTEKFNILDL